ncbi:MAG: thermonuclease family protein [Blastocatellia bacterium]
MQKVCPECGVTLTLEEQVCSCGHFFLDVIGRQQSANADMMRQSHKRTLLGKIAAVFAFFALSGGSLAYWFYSDRFEGSTADEIETASDIPASFNAVPTFSKSPPKNAFDGRVISVLSGDTLHVTDRSSKNHQVKLSSAKAPDPAKPIGKQSRDHLANLVQGRDVVVIAQRNAENGTIIGKVMFAGVNLGAEQIRSGFALFDQNEETVPTQEDQDLYSRAEAYAKNSTAGIWSGNQAEVADILAAPSNTGTVVQRNDGGFASAPVGLRTKSQNIQPSTSVEVIQTDNSASAGSESRVPFNSPPVVETNKADDQPTTTGSDNTSKPLQAQVPANTSTASSNKETKSSGTKTYILGPRGGCYYLTASGSKSYVDRSRCN